jgi:hypothetical protein
MCKIDLKLLFVIFSIFVFYNTFGQTPFIRNYTPTEYNSEAQSIGIAKDKNGIMYFSNANGIVEYDGTNWNFIKTPNLIRRLVADSSGVIYCGEVDVLGYLKPDNYGKFMNLSLEV